MITGNMTLHSKPNEDELNLHCICPNCMKEVQESPIDDSFDDQFGMVTDWSVGCPYCGSEVFEEGKIFLDVTSVHTAKKDHVKKGVVVIKAGQKYRKHVVKGYYVDGDGKHEGFFNVSKKLLKGQ